MGGRSPSVSADSRLSPRDTRERRFALATVQELSGWLGIRQPMQLAVVHALSGPPELNSYEEPLGLTGCNGILNRLHIAPALPLSSPALPVSLGDRRDRRILFPVWWHEIGYTRSSVTEPALCQYYGLVGLYVNTGNG